MENELKTILIPGATAVVLTVALLIARAVTLRILHGWAEKTETAVDDIFIKSLRMPSIYWCIAAGLYVGVAISDLPAKYILYLTRAIDVLVVLSVTLAASSLTGRLFGHFVRRSGLPVPATGLANGVIRGFVFILGFLIMLGMLGVSVTPLITALGVGGLAVALALQDTLSNLFSGIHLLVEKSIRVGDFIRLETGQEGYVVDITWRTTRIKMLPNNMVVIPNSKLAQSVVTNYYLPEKEMSVLIPIGVSYSSDPDTVEQILVEESKKAVGKVPGLLPDPEPFVRFVPGFGESSLDFTLVCRVAEFTDQYTVQHELRKRIFKRFRAEGIEIPYPHRTVYLKKES